MLTQSLISKIFAVTNHLPIVDQLQEYATNQTVAVIPNLSLDRLVDDDFIAAFCMKGNVTVLPLIHCPEFMFSVQECYRTNLRQPKFMRNGPLHRRLRQFLSSCSRSLGAKHVTCFVNWTPDPVGSGVALNSSSISSLNPLSLARYLSSDNYHVIKSMVEVTQRTLHLPELFIQSSSSAPCKTEENTLSSVVFDADRARGAFQLLALAVTGLGHPPVQAPDIKNDA
ncbi:unnamed protein product [Echinostoma caproni]|uniref:DZF domain-containing protein n=1 Tax=Echinostoma caproni TaxID=27848 RepID=A0A183ARC8_9TREM|nr:unnamed protein product [Echinostoma caproni]